jgi:uncharacterized protein (DUF1778 family)
MSKLKAKAAAKTSKLQLRLRPSDKAVISRAASLQQTTLSKFVLENAVKAAQQAVADQVHFTVSPEKWQAFCQALDAPPRVIPALQELFSRPSVFDGPAGVSSK